MISRTMSIYRIVAVPRTICRFTPPSSRSLVSAVSRRGTHYNGFSTATADEKKPPVKEEKKPESSPSIIQGVALSAATATIGFQLADQMGLALLHLQGIDGGKSPISGIPVSILLGLSIRNFILPHLEAKGTSKIYKTLETGIKYSTTTLLRAGIVCVGFKLSGNDIVSNALVCIPAVSASISMGMISGILFSRYAGLPHKMGSLIAAGSSICGVTAITALAPVIKADERDVAFAIATVVAFGTTSMLVYPYLAHALLSNSQAIGLFLGCAIHDTSQVIGSALTYGQIYGDDAVLKAAAVTKLTRNLFLAGVIPALALHSARQEGLTSTSEKLSVQSFMKYFPPFVGGFIGMACLRTAGDVSLDMGGAAFGLMSPATWSTIHSFIGNDLGSTWLLGTAMAAVGLSTNAASLRGVGVKPFIVGGSAAGVVGLTGFTMAQILC